MPSIAAIAASAALTAVYWIVALTTKTYPGVPAMAPSSFSAFVVLSVLPVLVLASYRCSAATLSLLICALIPLDRSVQLHPFPVLSPVDWVAGAALISLLGRWRQLTLLIRDDPFYGWMGAAWLAFILWGILDALLMRGSLRPLLRWCQFLLPLILSSLAAREEGEDYARQLVQLLAACGALVGLLGIMQFIAYFDHTKVQGTFQQHNAMAAYLTLTFWPTLARPSIRASPFWGRSPLLIESLSILFTFSRGAWIGLLAGFFSLRSSLRTSSQWIYVVLALGGLGLIGLQLQGRLLSDSQRLVYWRAGVHVLLVHPLTGLGPGNYSNQIRFHTDAKHQALYDMEKRVKRRQDFWSHLHNLYLQMAVEYGMVGFALWVFAFGGLFLKALERVHKSQTPLRPLIGAALVGFLVHNLVDITTVNSFDLLISTFLGLCIATPADRKVTS